MDTILNTKDKPVVDEMKEFLKNLTIEERKQISILIKGIELGVALKTQEKSA